MSDDEADPELLALLREALRGKPNTPAAADAKVLASAEYIYNNSIDVAIDMRSTKTTASMILEQMQKKEYSTKTWASHDLHPKSRDESTVAFIFTMDLLNFSFWSEKDEDERFAIEYKGKKWTGYWSLVAALQRALDEGMYAMYGLYCTFSKRLFLCCWKHSNFDPLLIFLVLISYQIFQLLLLIFGRTRLNSQRKLWNTFSGPQPQNPCPC